MIEYHPFSWPTGDLYGPDDNYICTIQNAVEDLQIRRQIQTHKLEGYYVISCHGDVMNILPTGYYDTDGIVDHFDKPYTDLMFDLLLHNFEEDD